MAVTMTTVWEQQLGGRFGWVSVINNTHKQRPLSVVMATGHPVSK